MSELKYYVYCHVNLVNNKKYFGITCRTPYKRWGHNGYNYKSSPYFYAAIQKYGWNGFEHIVLGSVSEKKIAEEIERALISAFQTCDGHYGYNIELGGNYKGKHSKEVCQKISESKIGKPRSEETKKKVSEGLRGKMVGHKNGRSKAVICLTTGKIYESMNLASKETGVQQSDISRCCSKQLKQTKGLKWQYYKDYLKGGENECEKT